MALGSFGTKRPITVLHAGCIMMMMTALNSLARQREVAQGEEEKEAGDRRKGGYSHKSISVRGVRCEEQ